MFSKGPVILNVWTYVRQPVLDACVVVILTLGRMRAFLLSRFAVINNNSLFAIYCHFTREQNNS